MQKIELGADHLAQEVTVTLPLGAVLRLANGDDTRPLPVTIGWVPGLDGEQLPVVGADWRGGKFAGLTIGEDGQPAALVLIPGDFHGTWQDAMDWADKEDAALPSRIDALVLYQNLKAEFKDAAYWTSAQHAADAAWAWYQYFDDGSQRYNNKDTKLRARAVRRVPL